MVVGGAKLLTVVMVKMGKMWGNKMKQIGYLLTWNVQSIQDYKASLGPVKEQKRDEYTHRERLREKDGVMGH